MELTIEERAKIANPNDVTKTNDLYEQGLYFGFEDGYIAGATEQKQIDFGKIDDDCEGCDLCKKVYQKKLIDKACEWITENYDVYGADKSIIEGLKEALKRCI